MPSNTVSRRRKNRDRVAKKLAAPLVPLDESSPEDFVTEQETSKQLGICVATLKNWRWRGVGPPFFKLGNRIARYSPRRNAAWAAGNLKTSTTHNHKEMA